jgi:hypothetical protein
VWLTGALWLNIFGTLGCSVCPEQFAVWTQAVLMKVSDLRHFSAFLVSAVHSALSAVIFLKVF